MPLRAAALQRAQRCASSGRLVTRRPSVAHADQQCGPAFHTLGHNSPCHTARSTQLHWHSCPANSVDMRHALWGAHPVLGRSAGRQLARARSSSNGIGGHSSEESQAYFDDDDYFFRDGLLADTCTPDGLGEVLPCWWTRCMASCPVRAADACHQQAGRSMPRSGHRFKRRLCDRRTCHGRISIRLKRQRSLLERGISQIAQTGMVSPQIWQYCAQPQKVCLCKFGLVKHVTMHLMCTSACAFAAEARRRRHTWAACSEMCPSGPPPPSAPPLRAQRPCCGRPAGRRRCRCSVACMPISSPPAESCVHTPEWFRSAEHWYAPIQTPDGG